MTSLLLLLLLPAPLPALRCHRCSPPDGPSGCDAAAPGPSVACPQGAPGPLYCYIHFTNYTSPEAFTRTCLDYGAIPAYEKENYPAVRPFFASTSLQFPNVTDTATM
jgi:hypothetical protein